MHPDNEAALKQRVVRAAEAALADNQYVSAIDVLKGMGLLQAKSVEDWRKGRLDYLERQIHTNLNRISLAMKFFRQWAEAARLKPSLTSYVRHTRGGRPELRFSKSGDPRIEKSYRTHYVSTELARRKQQRLAQKPGEPDASAGLATV